MLPRFSAWYVFLLYFLTLGIYPLYWLINRTQLIRKQGITNISTNWAYATLVLYFPSQILQYVSDAEEVVLAAAAINIVYMVTYLVAIFTLRNRLQEQLGIKLGWFMTFFFNVLYMQYKINELHDSQQATAAPAEVVV